MSITKARYHGKYVYASAELKGEIVQCIYCGCNMYTRRFPGREEYCYARMPGEVHTNEACQRYEDKTNMPLLPPTAEEFILALLKPEKDKGNGTTGASGVEGKARYIRLCLDCKSCFAAIKDKLFVSGETENGKYSTYIPREPQLELLVAGNWVTMSKEDCHAKCPTHFCIGTYWAKCNSGRQIALIKNKYKDIKEK